MSGFGQSNARHAVTARDELRAALDYDNTDKAGFNARWPVRKHYGVRAFNSAPTRLGIMGSRAGAPG